MLFILSDVSLKDLADIKIKTTNYSIHLFLVLNENRVLIFRQPKVALALEVQTRAN